MVRYVALLRALNVPGHARISAKELVQTFAAAGAIDVISFGHAGSIVFSARRGCGALVARARSRLGRRFGERPTIVVRTAAEIARLVASDPFASRGTTKSAKRYVAFLARTPRRAPKLPLRAPAERLTALEVHNRNVLVTSSRKANGFYGFPNAFVEAAFGVAATSRNWSTVTRLATLLHR